MADQKFGQPVRSEQDVDNRLLVKHVDFTNPAQGQEVDTDGNAHTEVHGNDPGGTDRVLRMSEQGSASVDGVYDASNNTDPSQVGLVGMVRNASPADSQQTHRLTGVANGAGDVRALDVAIRHPDGDPITITKPLAVEISESTGDEIVNYDTTSNVASDASDNHDYTVTALKTLLVDEILCSASGRAKYEVQVETGVGAGTFATRAVAFGTATGPTVALPFHGRLKVAAGVIIRVIRTNTDKQAQDVYSTIVGREV